MKSVVNYEDYFDYIFIELSVCDNSGSIQEFDIIFKESNYK